jgi:hypothetical protein
VLGWFQRVTVSTVNAKACPTDRVIPLALWTDLAELTGVLTGARVAIAVNQRVRVNPL